MALTYFLAQFIGFYMLIIAALFLFRTRPFIEAIKDMCRSEAMLVIAGLIGTFVGLLMVLSHNVWNGNTLALWVSLFGWATLLKGLALLFMPQKTIAAWTRISQLNNYWYAYVILLLLMGLYFLHGGIAQA